MDKDCGENSITIIQPAVPAYRLSLFNRLFERFGTRFRVYTSKPEELGALVEREELPVWQYDLGQMRQLLPGLEWQSGALSVPISKGDCLVVCGAPRTLSTLVLLLKARFKGARTIWWGHYWSASSKPWRAALRFALMKLADALVFYTDKEVEEYRSRFHKSGVKAVSGLNNGIETDQIRKLRKLYAPVERSRDLLFIGRLTKKAELDLLLEALSRPECRDVELDVVGDGETMSSLQQLAADLGMSERVVWHGAIIDEEEIAVIANQCKGFVYPGSVGLSLIHGLAYGLPAIVHNDRKTQMPEFAAMNDGVNGRTFRVGDAQNLAQVIHELLSNEMTLIEMSAEAITTTEESFNIADMEERFANILK